MTRILLLATITFFALLAQLRAGDPSARKPRATQEADVVHKAIADRFRSVRIVRDLASFDMLSLNSQKDGAWMVAAFRDGGSGLYSQGQYIEAETGRVIDTGIRPVAVLQVWGKWKRLELLSGEAPREGRYQWKEPDRSGFWWDRSKSLYDHGSVFEGPDVTVICRFFEKKAGAAQFSPVTAIPDEWRSSVKPAYEFHVQHSADIAASAAAGLRTIALSENPFVALTAIRQLLSKPTTGEGTDAMVDLVRTSPKYRQAVLTYGLLKQHTDNAREILKRYPNNSDVAERSTRSKENDENTRDIVLKAVSRTRNPAELSGMALGIECWTASLGREGGVSGTVMSVREKVVEKWQSHVRSNEADWQSIILATGTPEGKPTPPTK